MKTELPNNGQLKKYWLIGSAITAVAAFAIAFAVASYSINNPAACEGPGIACGIGDVLSSIIDGFIAYIVSGIFLMLWLVTSRRALAIYAFLFTTVPAYVIGATLSYQLRPESFNSGGRQELFGFAITAVLAVIILPIEIKLFDQKLRFSDWTSGIGLAAIEIFIFILIMPPFIKTLDNLGDKHRLATQLKSLNTQLYKPGYAVASTFFNKYEPTQPFYEIRLDDYSKLNEFKAPANYNPPNWCMSPTAGYPDPDSGYYNFTCTDIGKSSSGCQVYYAQVGAGDQPVSSTYGFCKIGSTLISFSSQQIFDKDQLKQILDSLQPATIQEMVDLANTH